MGILRTFHKVKITRNKDIRGEDQIGDSIEDFDLVPRRLGHVEVNDSEGAEASGGVSEADSQSVALTAVHKRKKRAVKVFEKGETRIITPALLAPRSGKLL